MITLPKANANMLLSEQRKLLDDICILFSLGLIEIAAPV
jgi:hypothetical protein